MEINRNSISYKIVKFLHPYDMPQSNYGFYLSLFFVVFTTLALSGGVIILVVIPFVAAIAFYYNLWFNDSAWNMHLIDGMDVMLVLFWIWMIVIILILLGWLYRHNSKNFWIFIDKVSDFIFDTLIFKWFKKQCKKQYKKLHKDITYVK